MRNCCSNASGLLKVSVVIILLAAVLHLIGFSVPFWSARLNSNEGLWEICAGGTCIVSSSDPISSEGWYKATQAFAILSLIFAVAAMILLFVAVCVPKLSRNKPILISALVISFVTAIWIVIALTIYGVRGKVFLESRFGSQFVVGFGFILFSISLFGYLFVALFVGMALNQIGSEEMEAEEKAAAEKSDDVEKGTTEGKPEETPAPAEEVTPVVNEEPPDTRNTVLDPEPVDPMLNHESGNPVPNPEPGNPVLNPESGNPVPNPKPGNPVLNPEPGKPVPDPEPPEAFGY